jgi:ribosomal protein S18 acetylase RimI-like enzyme
MTGGAVATRHARPEDAAAIARLLMEALGSKYRPALGRHAERALAVLVRRELERGAAAPAYLVAVAGGAPAGVVHLGVEEVADEALLGEIARVVGWPRAAWAGVTMSLLSHGRLAADEAYVEELAVAPEHRRRGVARQLLAACEEEARRRGKRRLTLWVTSDNAAAIGLYRGAGFRVARRRRWVVGRLVFRSPGALLMEKALRD